MNTSNNILKEKLEMLKNWLVRYSKIVLPIILVVCVGLTVVIAIHANKRKVEQEETVIAPDEDADGDFTEVPDVPLEKDAVPEINELFETYYKAMVEGDTETMGRLVYYLDAEETLNAVETSKYIESYPPMEVYTLVGPKEDTYIVWVYAELKFKDYDKAVPGLRAYYVCRNEDGDWYINEDGEESENELHYMREVQLQDDVIDLNNRVTAAYNDMIAGDKTLADFLVELDNEIDKNVGEALVRAKEEAESGDGESEGGEDSGDSTEESASSGTVVTKVKTTDVVNIRTSDSETADKLGKADVGDEFELLEERGNGWSKIRYDGGEAFIKSDYLEPSETKTQQDLAEAGEEETSGEQAGNSAETAPAATNGTVTVKETVRIRSGASENSEKIATAYMGEKFEVIMKQADGWTKIKYNGQTAYVKSDYVE